MWSLSSAPTSELHPPVANGTEWKLVAALTHLAARRKCPQSLSTACLFEFGHLFLATPLYLAGVSLNLSRPASEWSLLNWRHAKRQQRKVPKYHFASLHFPTFVLRGWEGLLETGETLGVSSLIPSDHPQIYNHSQAKLNVFSLQKLNINAAFCRLKWDVVWKGDRELMLCVPQGCKKKHQEQETVCNLM